MVAVVVVVVISFFFSYFGRFLYIWSVDWFWWNITRKRMRSSGSSNYNNNAIRNIDIVNCYLSIFDFNLITVITLCLLAICLYMSYLSAFCRMTTTTTTILFLAHINCFWAIFSLNLWNVVVWILFFFRLFLFSNTYVQHLCSDKREKSGKQISFLSPVSPKWAYNNLSSNVLIYI